MAEREGLNPLRPCGFQDPYDQTESWPSEAVDYQRLDSGGKRLKNQPRAARHSKKVRKSSSRGRPFS
jgi:hypothetical protein